VRLEHRDGVVEIAEQQRVGDEPRLVADDNRHLAEPVGEALDVLDYLLLGDHSPHDLDQLEHRRRVEEVHADDLRRPTRGHGDLGDRQRRRVGREHRVRLADLVQGSEDLPLELEPLRDGLDHQIDIGEVVQRRGEPHPPDQRGLVLDAELAALDCAVRRVRQVLTTALERVLGWLDAHDLQPLTGEHLGDAGTHRAQTDHAHRVELPAHGRSALIARNGFPPQSPRCETVGTRRPEPTR
jgi:hypothetical protein